MITNLINKGLMVVFFMALVNIIRTMYFVIQAWSINKERFVMGKVELLIMWLSVSYVLMSIFNGIGL